MLMAPSATTITEQYAPTIISLNGNSTNENRYSSAGYGRLITKDALKKRIESIDTDACEAGEEDAFFVADMGEVYRQHLRWKMNLKRVRPHYGMLLLRPPVVTCY
jgi:ornithine decarboxylase